MLLVSDERLNKHWNQPSKQVESISMCVCLLFDECLVCSGAMLSRQWIRLPVLLWESTMEHYTAWCRGEGHCEHCFDWFCWAQHGLCYNDTTHSHYDLLSSPPVSLFLALFCCSSKLAVQLQLELSRICLQPIIFTTNTAIIFTARFLWLHFSFWQNAAFIISI